MRRSQSVPLLIAIVVTWAGVARAQSTAPHEHSAGATEFKIPASLTAEHQKLHEELAAIAKLPGQTGEAARHVEEVLHPHFVSEEEFALPPLGLLSDLAAGKLTATMRDVIPMTDRLKANLPRMLDEHKKIVAALDALDRAGTSERHPEAVEFAKHLREHAGTEEQVLYPAAILVGEYVNAKAPR